VTDLSRKRTTLTNAAGTQQTFDEIRKIQALKFGLNDRF